MSQSMMEVLSQTPPPLVHVDDPDTSREASAKHPTLRETQRLKCLEVVEREPGLTGSEIAERVTGDCWVEDDPYERLYQVRRALSHLKHGEPGLVHRKGRRGDESLWYPGAMPQTALLD